MVIFLCRSFAVPTASAQGVQPPGGQKNKAGKEKPSSPRGAVTVKPRASDKAIRERIEHILDATKKYTETKVIVDDGVVFLQGKAKSDRLKEWAAETAGKVEDVVAVFNGIEVERPSPWDFQPAQQALQGMWYDVIRALPFIIFGLITLVLAYLLAVLLTRVTMFACQRHLTNNLLRQVLARALGLLVFLGGLYLVLQVAGLTRLALTVIGGTGLLGLVLGIAFRDITENFLASIFLSMQQPFGQGDTVRIGETLGIVQSLTYRVTILMTFDGNHVQIPNATVYKSNICNFTSNPNSRQEFNIGVGYDVLIPEAQEIASEVLANHPAVLKDPEPWVLVTELNSATVNLRVYFWLNVHEHSALKVKSSVMRLIKHAFQDADISMPDDAREILFPDGVPVRMIDKDKPLDDYAARHKPEPAHEPESVATLAEGGLSSEAEQIDEQARHSKNPEGGENLLRATREKAELV